MIERTAPDVDPRRFASFGPHSVLHAPVVSIPNPAGVHVGSWVSIGSYSVIEALVPERGVTVHIADGVYIGHFLRLTAMTEVRIGAEAMLSDRVYVADTGHEYRDVTVPIKRQPLLDGRRVEIGAGAWVGIGAVIVGDVRIGTNAVVAANSVVREDVPDFAVVAGDPARVIRYHDGETWASTGRDHPALD